jgi:4-hydroxy-3-polyprenylbenzoate decarboxylase
MMPVYAVAITGGSGAPYALRLLRALLDTGHEVHLVISPAGETILQVESGIRLGKTLREKAVAIAAAIETEKPEALRVFDPQNLAAPISSGSFACAGMVIVPCSTGTLGRIANGISSNLIERAADVMLKERRPLVVVPRETPLNEIQLRNMLALRQAGADILPAMPAFYHKPRNISDLVDMIVGRVLDRLGVENELFHRWGGDAPAED